MENLFSFKSPIEKDFCFKIWFLSQKKLRREISRKQRLPIILESWFYLLLSPHESKLHNNIFLCSSMKLARLWNFFLHIWSFSASLIFYWKFTFYFLCSSLAKVLYFAAWTFSKTNNWSETEGKVWSSRKMLAQNEINRKSK